MVSGRSFLQPGFRSPDGRANLISFSPRTRFFMFWLYWGVWCILRGFGMPIAGIMKGSSILKGTDNIGVKVLIHCIFMVRLT